MGGIVDSIFGGGPDVPDPNEVSAAESKANIEAARVTAALNRANQITPLGSLTWSQTPGGQDSWTSKVILDPRVQAILDQQLAAQQKLGTGLDSAASRVNALGDVQGIQLPGGAMPTANDAYRKQIQDAVYGQMASRLDPQFAQRESDLTSRLAAQGITQGSEAYNREFSNFGRDRNDAYQTAMNNAFTQGEAAIGNQFGRDMSTRQQGVGEAQTQFQSDLVGRGQVLNELQALRSNQQVAMPQFGSTQSGASVAPANVGANTWNSYNAGQAQATQQANTFGQIAQMAAMFFSDRRLKSNVVRIGTHPLGIGLYEYDIFGERQRGVMADEVESVLPEAVMEHESGFKMVNYALL